MRKIFLFISLFIVIIHYNFAQEVKPRDKGVFKEYEPGYFQNVILKAISENEAKPEEVHSYFEMDFEGLNYPTDPEKYTQYFHQDPLSQGRTGTCWCFATTSFLESEVYRLTGEKVKLSEMYTVYWEYVERAKAYIEKRGKVYFAEGSEATSVLRIMKLYGAVPESTYNGLLEGQQFHDHQQLIKEMTDYLTTVKQSNNWNEEEVLSTIKQILNKYMGEPPTKIDAGGYFLTPKEYVSKVLKLNPDDYFSFMSTLKMAYNEKGELKEDDNWWHCDDYYNVSPDDFMLIINNAIQNGYTISICGDVSEPGYDRFAEVGVIPTFDIASKDIDAYAREYRLENGATTDDHCLHLVGYQKLGDEYWYLVKDSGSGGFDGPHKGYRFISQDYVKLKMMNIMLHKNGAKPLLDKIIK